MNFDETDFFKLDIDKKIERVLNPNYRLYWINRIKYDTPLWISFLVIYLILWINLNFIIYGLDHYLQQGYIIDLIVLSSFFFLIYMCNVMPKRFLELVEILDEKKVFQSEEYFSTYLDLLYTTYESKKEKYIPLFGSFFFIVGINIFIFFVENRFDFFGILNHVMASILYSLLFLLFISAIILFSYGTKFLNVLGTEEVKLNINYTNLAVINDIGSFIMKIAIPSSILSTLYSILGLILILLFRHPNGYVYIIGGLLIIAYVIFLFYKSTINLHKEIVKAKRKLKEKLLGDIDKITGDIENIEGKKCTQSHKLSQKYQTICNIHEYINKIDKINDWPFNSASIKKLIISLSTPILTIVFSLFGLF